MKIPLQSFTFFVQYITFFPAPNSAETRLVAVSPLVGSESYYVYVRKRRLGKRIPYATYPAEEPAVVKESICADILGSPLFEISYGVDRVNIYLPQNYPTVYENLKQKYPLIYTELYARFPNDTDTDSKTNSYQVRNVTISKRSVYEEHMFVCWAHRRESGEVVKYYISRKYNINEYIRHTASRIEGRFVFAMNELGQMNVIALAEEPAHQSFDQNTIEGIYMEYINKRVRKCDHLVDPLCALPTARKVRLCTIILNAVGCRDSIHFHPHESSILPECDKKPLSFKHKKKAASYQEWMIGCKGEVVASGEPIIYYVSRGYRPSTYYVYRERDGKMEFDHLSSDVGLYTMSKNYMGST